MQVDNFQSWLLWHAGSGGSSDLCHLLWDSSNHCLYQPILFDLAHRRVQHALAVAQHSDPVAYLIDLLKVMGDVEDTNPALFEAADSLKEAFDSSLLQRGRWFIENQERAPTDRARAISTIW